MTFECTGSPWGMKTHCCCLTLKTGTLFAGGYSLVVGSITTFVSIYMVREELPRLKSTTLDPSLDLQRQYEAAERWVGAAAALSAAWALAALLLLYGMYKNSRGMLVPWVFVTMAVTVFSALGLYMSWFQVASTFRTGVLSLAFVLEVASFVLNLWCMFGVASYHRYHPSTYEKKEKEAMDNYAMESSQLWEPYSHESQKAWSRDTLVEPGYGQAYM